MLSTENYVLFSLPACSVDSRVHLFLEVEGLDQERHFTAVVSIHASIQWRFTVQEAWGVRGDRGRSWRNWWI